MIESSHQPKYFPTYCNFPGLGTCPKTKGRSVVDPTAWPFHRPKPSNILCPSVQWQMLFPFQPGVVVRHENPRCFSLCVVCFKLLQKPSLISISIRQSTMIHILAREWNCEADPLRNPVTLGKGNSRGYRHPYRSFTCWAFRTFFVGRNCSVSAHPSTQRPSCYPFITALSKGLLNAAPQVKLFKELGSFLMSGKAVHGNPSTHVSSQKRFTRAPRFPRVSGRTSSTKMNGKSVGRLVDDVPCRLETNFLKLPTYKVSTSSEMSSDLCMGGGSQVSIGLGGVVAGKDAAYIGLGFTRLFLYRSTRRSQQCTWNVLFENSDRANSEQEKT